MRNKLKFEQVKSKDAQDIESLFENQSVFLNIQVLASERHFVQVQNHIKTTLVVDCNICSQEVLLDIDQQVQIVFTDKIYKDGLEYKGCEVIECFDGFIDFDEFIHSEMMLIKSDYHYCKSCQDT